MNKLRSVCKDCGRREIGCHGLCEDYKSARAEYDAQQDIIRQAKLNQGDIIQLKKEGVAKMRKRYRSRKAIGGDQ